MAKVQAIKDPVVLAIMGKYGKPNEPWNAEKHKRCVIDYFRSRGFLANASKEQVSKEWAAFSSFWDNGHFSYASNQAKHAVASGLALNTQAKQDEEYS